MVSFKLFAGTDVGLRDNNEDNFAVCPDLNKEAWIVPADNRQAIRLGTKGCVMVVADGMGGQNAGEVASAIAVATVQDMFASDHLSPEVIAKPDAIKSFLKKTVVACDVRIKKRTEKDASTYGMGSTIVIAWLLGKKLYVAWLGDSRAYSFVKGKGIARLSKDHSYVQQLVDAGTITEEEAMNHPNSNVITRSLGDFSQKAKADVAEYDVEDGEVILLCSDGLCGVCRDEEIGGIIEEETGNLQTCKEKLTAAALQAGGSDNITIALLQVKIRSGNPPAQKSKDEDASSSRNAMSMSTWLAIVFGLCMISALLYAGYSIIGGVEEPPVKRVEIWVDKNKLKTGESTRYHIAIIGDSFGHWDYDPTMVEINEKDSTIKVTKACLRDTMVVIKVICKDPALVASTKIQLKRALIEPTESQVSEPSSDGNSVEDVENTGVQTPVNEQNTDNQINNSISPSYVKNPGEVTSAGKNKNLTP